MNVSDLMRGFLGFDVWGSFDPPSKKAIKDALCVATLFGDLELQILPSGDDILITYREGRDLIISSVLGNSRVHSYVRLNGDKFYINNENVRNPYKLEEVIETVKEKFNRGR